MANEPWEPDWTLPPGETLREVMDLKQITAARLAEVTGLDADTVDGLLVGAAELTPAIAGQLEQATGVPARLWTNMENIYRHDLIRLGR